MIARDCTQVLDVVQHGVIDFSDYSQFACTSQAALWRQDGLTYVITEGCPAGEKSCRKRFVGGDSGDPDQSLAHMLLEKLAWKIETIAPGLGQEKS